MKTSQSVLLQNLAMVIPLILVIAPFFDASFFPTHDNLYRYQIFRSVYSEIMLNGDYPLWLPYGGFGIPSYFSIILAIPPTLYAVGVVGLLLSVENTLLLFKLSISFEYIVFAIGVCNLAKLYISSFTCRFLLLCFSLLTIFSASQPWFNLSIYYLVPLIIYFMARALAAKQPTCWWLAACLFVIQLPGNNPYFLPVQIIPLLIIILCIFLRKDWRAICRSLFPCDSYSFSLFLTATLLSACLLFLLLEFSDATTLLTRDGSSPLVKLEEFRSHGVHEFGYVLFSYLSGFSKFTAMQNNPELLGFGTDATIYVGLLPIGLFVGSLFYSDRGICHVSNLIVLIMLAVCTAGMFATLLYFIYPPIQVFRHLGLLYEFTNKFLIWSAFCFLDELIENRRLPKKIPSNFKSFSQSVFRGPAGILRIGFLLLAFDIWLNWGAGGSVDLSSSAIWQDEFKTRIVIFGFLSLLIFFPLFTIGLKPRIVLAILFLVSICDLGINFKTNIDAHNLINQTAAQRPVSWTKVEHLRFQKQRVDNLLNSDKSEEFSVLMDLHGANYADGTFMFLNEDSCIPQNTTIFYISRSLFEAFSVSKASLRAGNEEFLNGLDTRLLGCGSPKLILDPGVSASINRFQSNNLSFTVISQEDTQLVYSDAFHEDWVAYIDGIPVTINNFYGLKRISVPSGLRLVEFAFSNFVVKLALILVATLSPLILSLTCCLLSVGYRLKDGLPR